MKKVLSLLLLFALCMSTWADEAFRLHRYDTFKVTPIKENSIVFVGNSITNMHPWVEAFGNDPRIVNRGNSGGTSAEILREVRSYCAGHPAKIFLMIGINDKPSSSNQTTIVNNIRQTIAAIKAESPSTQIYVQSILPSARSGFSNPTDIGNCNTAIQAMLESYPDVTYIDVYSLLLGKVNDGGNYSYDLLHLTAASYEIWTKKLQEYIDCTSAYPSGTDSKQTRSTLSQDSFGMRGTYFSVLPIANDDVLFFGDEMVHGGEWQELLGNVHVKNRGTNWDYDKTINSMTYTAGNIDCTFATVSGVVKNCPKQVILYTGTGEVNNTSNSVSTAVATYKSLVSKIRNYTSATTKISLVSLMPTNDYSNNRVQEFNQALSDYAATDSYLEYIDIYSTLSTASGAPKIGCFPASNNYLYGDGYVAVANVLAQHIDGCNPVTAEQAAAYRALVEGGGEVESAPAGIVGGKNYTIKPYGTSKYVVPSSTWANRGGKMTSYSTATPTIENGAVWTFQSADGGFVIKPASSSFATAYLNPWNAGSVSENAIGVWDTADGDQVWNATAVTGKENVYTIQNKNNSTAYMYYKSDANELYFNKPGTPTESHYFVIEPFGDEPSVEPDPVADNVLWTGNINNSSMPWMRIPAIVKTQSGDLLAFADYRYNHDDIGRNNSLNNGRIDIQMRRSTDGGQTWSNAVTVAQGSGENNATDAGYGDAAVVADNGGSGKMLLLAAAGSVNYGNSTRSNPIRMAKFTSNNNGQSWSAATDITSTFYGLLPNSVTKAFSTSGRIEQSAFRKNDASYNRIYDPLCTGGGNYVLYSDDFGETWAVLGGTSGQTYGDEAHVVELPNGDILLVSRKESGDGRYINIFTYSKDANGVADFSKGGTWATNGYENGTSAARCNGDIDIVTAYPAGSSIPTNVLIQSAPYNSSPRRQVTYHYKALPTPNGDGTYSLSDFTSGWTKGLEISSKASAYSSIVNLGDGNEAMLYEESEKEVTGTSDPYAYNIVFVKNSISEITKGDYVAEPADNMMTVTYTFKVGETVIGTKTRTETRGAAPTISDIIPSYVTAENLPATVTTDAYTINTSYKNTVPFEVGTKFYQLTLTGGLYWIYANSSVANVKESKTASDAADYIWRVGGDWLNGFTFRNMLGYYIAATSTTPSNGDNTARPTEATELTHFDMVQNGTFGFRFKPHNGSNYLAHTSANALNLQFFDYYGRDRVYNSSNQIEFTENTTFVAALQTKIDEVYSKKGQIGYPVDMESLAPYLTDGVNGVNYETAAAALNALYSGTNINLPVPGKAYRIAVNGATGNKWYVPASGAPATNVANAATFVCGKEGSKFIFVLNDGSKYMTYNGANTNLANYDARWNSFTVSSLSAKPSTGFNGTYPAAARFGYVFIESSGRDASQANKEGCLVVQESNGSWSAADDPFFNGAHTSAITFEEVANDVYVKLNNPNEGGTSGLDGKYVGTFSAPYHVALPAGVKAYTAAIDGTTVNLNEHGTTVPANTGVLLYAENATAAINETPIPVGTATAAGDNAFLPTTGGEIPEGSYILANKNNHVAFYLIGDNRTVAKNKAYLTVASGSNNLKVRFDFEETTGIDAVENASENVVYDLAGRRISNAKSGLYIVNGKKVIR